MKRFLQKWRLQNGQSAVGYLLITVIAVSIIVILTSEQVRSALGVLYRDMATRILSPGAIDSDQVHQEALQEGR